MPDFKTLPEGHMFPVGTTFAAGELTDWDPDPDPELEKNSWWDPHERDRVWPGLKFREAEGELSTESSPDGLLGLEPDFLGKCELGTPEARPVNDPDELELLLLVVVMVAATSSPPLRVRSGETGEPRSSSLKSGLSTLTPLSCFS